MDKFIRNKNSLLNNSLVGVEIGVFGGNHAYFILRKLNMEKLFLIDPYSNDNYDEITNLGTRHLFMAQRALKRFNGKYVQIRKRSADAVDMVPDGLDFVYIDGDHRFDFVMKDIELYFPKVKSGGVFGGHDYCDMHPDVIRAVDDFVDKTGYHLFQEDIDWWVVK